MKSKFFASITFSLLSLSCFAQTKILCRLADGVAPSDVVHSFDVVFLDAAQNSPFVLFDFGSEARAIRIRANMASSPLVIWTEDNIDLGTPEGQKGSTLPAVGGRDAGLAYNTQALNQINWQSAIANEPGRQVRVAILDSGISPKAFPLWRKVVATANYVEANYPAWDIPHQTDSNLDGIFDNLTGHGTMVAGLINQISPQSLLIPVRVADSDGFATTWRLIKGIVFAINNGAEVINISLGTLTRIPSMTDVLDWADLHDATVVAAIGNNGVNDSCSPARIRAAICVGGLDDHNAKASFSNWDGTCLASAPAVTIGSTDWTGRLGVWSGTSFATPFVAGSVAELLRHSTALGASSWISNAIKNTSVDISLQNPNYRGKIGGLLNFANLIINGHR